MVKEELISPMLLGSCNEPFDSDEFMFEFKFDGVRMILDYSHDEPMLYNRHKNIKTALYPEITATARLLQKGCVLDGEVIAVSKEGIQSFYAVLERDLAKNYRPTDARIFYIAFDILMYKNKSIIDKPLFERKKLLDEVLVSCNGGLSIRAADSFLREGKMLFEAAKQANMEGIVAKKISGAYRAGARSNDWLKIKNARTIEATILGFKKTSERISLLLGIKAEDSRFKYIGNVSNGLSKKDWQILEEKLQGYETHNPTLSNHNAKEFSDAIFVEPLVKVQVKYLEALDNGHLRQPVILKQ